jgi:selenide,water dikinase
MKKLLLLGGGHAQVEVLRQFALQRPDRAEITLVSPDRHTPYSGMLPGLVAGHYAFGQCHIDLQPLADRAGARLLLTHARALDAVRRVVTLADGSDLGYDIASIDVGSVPLAQTVAGVADYAIPVKPVRGFLAAWEALQVRVRAGAVRCIAVVGGGAAGVEMLLAMQYRLAQLNPRVVPAFALITDTPQLLPQHPRGVRTRLERSLERKGVAVYRALRVTRVTADTVSGSDAGGREQRVAADAVLWVTGAAPPAWLADSGLDLNDKKFLNINKYLQNVTQGNVFAAGDCATIAGAAYPKSGVYAVRQGPVLAHNLRQALGDGAALQAYTPQKNALALISTGERHAIASWGAIAFHGNWVWRWKDRIDRAFMAKYGGA